MEKRLRGKTAAVTGGSRRIVATNATNLTTDLTPETIVLPGQADPWLSFGARAPFPSQALAKYWCAWVQSA